ncbi:MAG: hypothetical protein H0W72_00385 [Planctomycetes bacterium]|nr:hypothetical protein [Planctomycetota bacterium]
MTTSARSGFAIVIVTGIIAMLAALVMAFLARSRLDLGQADQVVSLAQCRLMLHAGISFVQESSRLGYARMDANGRCQDPREGWGWIDPRVKYPGTTTDMSPDDRIGPNAHRPMTPALSGATDPIHLWVPGQWPAPGTVHRAPMQRLTHPPFAVAPIAARNPMPTDPALPTFGIPFLSNPDPLPMVPATVTLNIAAPRAVDRKEWAVPVDRSYVTESAGLGWFRVRREDGTEVILDEDGNALPRAKLGTPGATFIITVGAGASRGWRDWAEVVAAGATVEFGSQDLFENLVAAEVRQWYRIEWSPAVGGGEDTAFAFARGNDGQKPKSTWYETYPVNTSRHVDQGEVFMNSASMPRNYLGTIRFIQRLAFPPVGGAW